MEKSCMLIQFSRWPKKMLRKHFFVGVNKQISKKICTILLSSFENGKKICSFLDGSIKQ